MTKPTFTFIANRSEMTQVPPSGSLAMDKIRIQAGPLGLEVYDPQSRLVWLVSYPYEMPDGTWLPE